MLRARKYFICQVGALGSNFIAFGRSEAKEAEFTIDGSRQSEVLGGLEAIEVEIAIDGRRQS